RSSEAPLGHEKANHLIDEERYPFGRLVQCPHNGLLRRIARYLGDERADIRLLESAQTEIAALADEATENPRNLGRAVCFDVAIRSDDEQPRPAKIAS